MESQQVVSTAKVPAETATPLSAPEGAAPKPQRKGKLYVLIGLFLFVLIIGIVGLIIFRKPSPNTPSSTEREAISNIPVATISSIPIQTYSELSQTGQVGFDQILIGGEYTEKTIQYETKSGPVLDKTNLKINLNTPQIRRLIKPAHAAEMIPLFPIYLQNPTIEELNKMAKTLGIAAPVTYPNPNFSFEVEYIDPKAKLTYGPGMGLHYESAPTEGSFPSPEEAKSIAVKMLQSLGISCDVCTIRTQETSIASAYEGFATLHKAISVIFLLNKDNYPVLMNDVDAFWDTETPSSPVMQVIVGNGNKVLRLGVTNYGQFLDTQSISMNARSLDMAVSDLRTYGGHIRLIREVESPKVNFACAENRCLVHDATISHAQIKYYWNPSFGYAYSEINDTNKHFFEYLVPVWVFEGTGLMDKSKTDPAGTLLPNPDKNNPDEYITVPVKFVATIPAFTQTNDVNLLGLRNYEISKINEKQIKVTFDTTYKFGTMGLSTAQPRNGIKYRLLILFPDKTYSIINGYKQEVYPGEVTFEIGDAKGTITTYLELTDFSNLIEKRTVTVE